MPDQQTRTWYTVPIHRKDPRPPVDYTRGGVDDLKKLYIEPTSRCNLSCKMCFRHAWIDPVLADMEWEVFERALDTQPDSVQTVFFGGMGEPLVHPRILDMVNAARATGRWVELLTNATLLTREMSDALLSAGLDKLWVSVDSTHPDMLTSGHEHVFDNIAAYTQARVDKVSPAKLGLAFVAMKSNAADIANLPSFAVKYNACEVNISNIIPSDENGVQEILYWRVMGTDVGMEYLQNALPDIKLPLMDFNLPQQQQALLGVMGSPMCTATLSGQPIRRKTYACTFIDEGHTFVRFDGNVAPCMALLHSSYTYLYHEKRMQLHHSYGNVAEDGLADIWNSQEYVDFRQRVRDFTFSPCIRCGGCYNREDNQADCYLNPAPTCGACLWSEGIVSCP